MNPEQEPIAFENHLKTYVREPLPEAWRDELVSNAILPSQPDPAVFTIGHKLTIGFIAACWLVIAGLAMSTPPNAATQDFAGDDIAESTPQIPFLVEYLQNRQSITELF